LSVVHLSEIRQPTSLDNNSPYNKDSDKHIFLELALCFNPHNSSY